jgi:transposase-like protein
MLICVRWHGAYPLRFRQHEKLMPERGRYVAYATPHR